MWGHTAAMRSACLYLWRWSLQAVVAVISLSLHVAPALGRATSECGRCTSLLVRQGFVGRGCLRGGGVFDGVHDKVTPDQIREIGEDVLKMWEVSHKETLGENASTGAAGALRAAASLRGASGSDELASLTKRSPSPDTKATSSDQPEDGPEDAEGPQKWSDDHQAASAQGKYEHQTLDLVVASIWSPLAQDARTHFSALAEVLRQLRLAAANGQSNASNTFDQSGGSGGDEAKRPPDGPAVAGSSNQSCAGTNVETATSSALKSVPQGSAASKIGACTPAAGVAVLPSIVTWNPLHSCAAFSSTTRNESTSSVAGQPSSDKEPTEGRGVLPSVLTWAPIQAPPTARAAATVVAAIAKAGQDTHEELVQPPGDKVNGSSIEEEKRKMDQGAASDGMIGNLSAVKTQLEHARKIVGQLRGQRAEAEMQLSEMERGFAQSQLAANERLWDAAAQGDVGHVR